MFSLRENRLPCGGFSRAALTRCQLDELAENRNLQCLSMMSCDRSGLELQAKVRFLVGAGCPV
jgi:hypothetical protein